MKRNKRLLLAVGIALALAAMALGAFQFVNTNTKPNDQRTIVAEGAGVRISAERFQHYKDNMAQVYAAQHWPPDQLPSDSQLLDELIGSDLAANYARDIGLEATAEEIDEAIRQERESLSEPDSEPDSVKTFMRERIERSGLTEEQFWSDDETRYAYEKAILLGKLGTRLTEEGRLQQPSGMSGFKKELLHRHRGEIIINEANMKRQ